MHVKFLFDMINLKFWIFQLNKTIASRTWKLRRTWKAWKSKYDRFSSKKKYDPCLLWALTENNCRTASGLGMSPVQQTPAMRATGFCLRWGWLRREQRRDEWCQDGFLLVRGEASRARHRGRLHYGNGSNTQYTEQ